MIKHKFKLIINGIQFLDSNSVDFKQIAERYRNIEMTNITGFDFELSITKRLTSPIEISINEAKIEANEFADRLSLIENHEITSLTYIGYQDKDDKLYYERKNIVLNVGMTALIRDPQQFYCLPDKKYIFNNKNNSGPKRVYRTALGITDRISQYLIFYGLLQILTGEAQSKVDDFIKHKISDILIVSGKYGDETIITKIRNIIAHPDNNFELEDINIKVNMYLETLRKLVFEILRKG